MEVKVIEYQDAKDDYLLNLKEDDWDFYWNATDKEITMDDHSLAIHYDYDIVPLPNDIIDKANRKEKND